MPPRHPSSAEPLSLLDADSDLIGLIPPQDLFAARRATTVPHVRLEPGPFDPSAACASGQNGFGALIVSGLITREVPYEGRPTLRLLGPDDVFVDARAELEDLDAPEAWNVLVTTHLAILDDRLILAVRRWPKLFHAVCARLQRCHDITLHQLATSHAAAAEDRVLGMFRLLADSWGRVSPNGIVLAVPLTHEMIGARRSTVTLALRTLDSLGQLKREGDRWLLARDTGLEEAGQMLAGQAG